MRLLFFLLLSTFAYGGEVGRKTLSLREFVDFKQVELFSNNINENVAKLVREQPSFIRFSLILDYRIKEVLLYKVDNTTNYLTNENDSVQRQGSIVNYRGCISDDVESIASFTLSDEIIGLISNSEGNYNIGKYKGSYIVYNDKELKQPEFLCYAKSITKSVQQPTTASANNCVNFYWEADYNIIQDKGSLAAVNTFMTALFNQTSTIYANDGVSVNLKTLYVWTSPSTYYGPYTSDYLDQFGMDRKIFDGDLAVLIGFKSAGGIAWIQGLCASQNKYKQAYCGIYNTFKDYPVYSWSVENITHEEGHLLGSNHTHDCIWNGNNTAIDNCGDSAGYGSGCDEKIIPVKGTIMSYCNLIQSVGVNFSLGFSEQPKKVIQDFIGQSPCLSECTTNVENIKKPVDKEFTVVEVYDITGKYICKGLLKDMNLSTGVYFLKQGSNIEKHIQ